VPTFGGLGQLPPDRVDALLTGMGDAIDSMGGAFTMHYTALVLTSVRTR
jgi:hypothetical protein